MKGCTVVSFMGIKISTFGIFSPWEIRRPAPAALISSILDGRKEYRLDVAVLTRRDVNDIDQRRPQRNKIAARTGKILFHF